MLLVVLCGLAIYNTLKFTKQPMQTSFNTILFLSVTYANALSEMKIHEISANWTVCWTSKGLLKTLLVFYIPVVQVKRVERAKYTQTGIRAQSGGHPYIVTRANVFSHADIVRTLAALPVMIWWDLTAVQICYCCRRVLQS